MILFDGKTEAEKLDLLIAQLPSEKKNKTLVIVQIGDNEASRKYVLLKQKYCSKFDMPCVVKNFSEKDVDDAQAFLKKVALDDAVSSIIIQLPLSDTKHYSLLDLLPLEKDVDILSSLAKTRFYTDNFKILSPVIRAVEHFLYSDLLNYDSIKTVGIIGYGDLVGKPLEKYLSSKVEKVEVIQNYLPDDSLNYDLLVLSTDVPNLVKGEKISAGCNVIDFGSSVINGKTVGNFDLESRSDHLGLVSKSPGGMGPLVVRYLVMNHLRI